MPVFISSVFRRKNCLQHKCAGALRFRPCVQLRALAWPSHRRRQHDHDWNSRKMCGRSRERKRAPLPLTASFKRNPRDQNFSEPIYPEDYHEDYDLAWPSSSEEFCDYPRKPNIRGQAGGTPRSQGTASVAPHSESSGRRRPSEPSRGFVASAPRPREGATVGIVTKRQERGASLARGRPRGGGALERIAEFVEQTFEEGMRQEGGSDGVNQSKGLATSSTWDRALTAEIRRQLGPGKKLDKRKLSTLMKILKGTGNAAACHRLLQWALCEGLAVNAFHFNQAISALGMRITPVASRCTAHMHAVSGT
ncbi:hypothetical protein CYMTET_13953 [Cymbomonas tetramitiformis]|uniref:Uncharacterized protein n=1 Tax=Cymbomonas tetramitiformis TaxID=36881 RepID=A0AAE0GHD9_9CHLO|nr:hypothetical protein CYMTET_13953 [Cymbomonas tetramitiformis]